MSEARKSRIENSFAQPPSCPKCEFEARVRPAYRKGGGIVAIVECRVCEYEGHFYPHTVDAEGRTAGGRPG